MFTMHLERKENSIINIINKLFTFIFRNLEDKLKDILLKTNDKILALSPHVLPFSIYIIRGCIPCISYSSFFLATLIALSSSPPTSLATMGKLTLQLILTLIVLSTTLLVNGAIAATETQPTIEYLSVGTVDYRPIYGGFSKVKVIHAAGPPFQQCSKCKCCAANNSSNCRTTSCCYKINCNIPGKPYGTCAFQPTACNCNSCN